MSQTGTEFECAAYELFTDWECSLRRYKALFTALHELSSTRDSHNRYGEEICTLAGLGEDLMQCQYLYETYEREDPAHGAVQTPAAPSAEAPAVLQAQAFELVDKAGRRRASLKIDQAESGLCFYNTAGVKQVELGFFASEGSDHAFLSMYDQDDAERFSLEVSQATVLIRACDGKYNEIWRAPIGEKEGQ